MTIKKIINYSLNLALLAVLFPFVSFGQTPNVDLLYESVSYTPPFYKGKALNPNQGLVVVTAIPEIYNSSGKKLSNNELNFKWKKDGVVQLSSSDLGRNYFSFAGTVPIRDIKVEVIVSSTNQSLAGAIIIPHTEPKIVFYENSPVYGIMMNRAITVPVKMQTDEFSTLAIPFFFSVDSYLSPNLQYTWNLNDKGVENQDPKNSFTTRVETPGSGTAEINLKINNTARIFQFIDNSYIINFEKQ